MKEKSASGMDPITMEESISQGSEGDENKERGNWGRKMDFLLCCIGFAVGLGNVWRFPYLCYRNGGGAFLVPYTIMLACAGLPLFFMELSFGQYASLGPITIWKVSPFFKGLGYAMITISGLTCIYYNVILMYTIFYLFASFNKEVPWKYCGNPWNTPACKELWRDDVNTTALNGTVFNGTRVTPASEYFERYVLDMSDGMEDLGGMRWQLVLCLLLAWIVVFVCLSKGIKSTGKVVYFTALFPYVVLLILLVRGVTLEGSTEGIKFYIIPDWTRLQDSKVWGDAAVQIFYSLGPAWGGLITMSSYNRFHNNCYRDAIIVAVVNCGTSVFAGFVIFSVIGFMAHELGVPVGDAARSGPGLAFVAYPEGIAGMPVSPLWAVIFFIMLWTLGLDSMFTMLETVISALVDEFPKYLRPHKLWFTLFISAVGFLLGLPMCTRGGIYIMTLMDWYCAGFSLLLVGLFEVIVLTHVYGYNRFASDIESMIGFRPNIYWRITWLLVTPMSLIFIIVFFSISYVPVYYGEYDYPDWADILGWLMVLAAAVWIPLFMIWAVLKQICKEGFTYPVLASVTRPTPDWGPALEINRRCNEKATQTGLEEDFGPAPAYDNKGFDDTERM